MSSRTPRRRRSVDVVPSEPAASGATEPLMIDGRLTPPTDPKHPATKTTPATK